MQALSSFLVTDFQIMAKEAINVLYVPFVGLAVYCDSQIFRSSECARKSFIIFLVC